MPKALRIYFKNDRNLFADVSKIIFSIINDYYNEASQTPLKTGSIISYQSFGDLVRSNPHYHCIFLEGGIDDEGCFHNLPIKDTVGVSTSITGCRSVQKTNDKISCPQRVA